MNKKIKGLVIDLKKVIPNGIILKSENDEEELRKQRQEELRKQRQEELRKQREEELRKQREEELRKNRKTVKTSKSKVFDSKIRFDIPLVLTSKSENTFADESISTSDIQNYSMSYYFNKKYGIGISQTRIKSNQYRCISSPECNLTKFVNEHIILFFDISYVFRLSKFNIEIGYPYPYLSKEHDFDPKQVDISAGIFTKIGYEIFDIYDIYYHLRSFSTQKDDTSNPKTTDIMFGLIGIGYYF